MRTEENPLAELDADRIDELTNALLEDWDCPTMTALGLCRAHRATLAQVRAISQTPRFRAALDDLRAIRDARRQDQDARVRATAVDRLVYLILHDPSTASYAKELRLAVKTLLSLTDPAQTRPASDDAHPAQDPQDTPDAAPEPPRRRPAPRDHAAHRPPRPDLPPRARRDEPIPCGEPQAGPTPCATPSPPSSASPSLAPTR